MTTAEQQASAGETVLVTGGTGFLASWVIVKLLEGGYAVRTTMRDLGRAETVTQAVGARVSTDALTFAQADLLSAEGWDAAVAGIDNVLHVASPLGNDRSQDLIRAARDGTRHVLEASARAGVRRFVLTSSGLAARAGHDDVLVNETYWGEAPDKPSTAYPRSKILSERDAWSFVESHADAPEFVSVLPGFIVGPVLSRTGAGSSLEVIRRLLAGAMPGLPNIGFGIVDVRDVADLHVRAMMAPEAAGERFLAVGEFLWLREIAESLRTQLGQQAAKVPTRRLPNMIVRIGGRINPQLAMLADELGQRPRVDGSKAERLLGWKNNRPATESVVDAARSLIEYGVVPDLGDPK